MTSTPDSRARATSTKRPRGRPRGAASRREASHEDSKVAVATASEASSPHELGTIGARVRWLLEQRHFSRTRHARGFGANRLDEEAKLRIGYTSQLVRDTFTFIPSDYLARIAKVLDTNMEWLATGVGPWERLPLFDDPEAGTPRAEAVRFGRICGLHATALEFIETRHAKSGHELTALEWFDLARFRDQTIKTEVDAGLGVVVDGRPRLARKPRRAAPA